MKQLNGNAALVPEVVPANPNRDSDLEWSEDEYYELRKKAIDLDHIMQAHTMAEHCASMYNLSGADKALFKMAWIEGFCGAKDWPILDKLK